MQLVIPSTKGSLVSSSDTLDSTSESSSSWCVVVGGVIGGVVVVGGVIGGVIGGVVGVVVGDGGVGVCVGGVVVLLLLLWWC